MTDPTTFDAELERRLRGLSAVASRPFDAGEVARAAVLAGGRRTTRWRVTPPLRLVLVGGLLLLALLGAAIVGSRLLLPSPAPAVETLALATSQGLWLQTSDGESPVLLEASGPYFTPAWSPDGTLLAATVLMPEDANSLALFHADGDLFATLNQAESARWSRDSRFLLIDGVEETDLQVVDTRSADHPELPLPDTLWTVRGADWLPDGRIVVGLRLATDAAPSLWIVDPAGAPPVRMGGDAGRDGSFPVVSPDGTRIAMLVEGCGSGGACAPRYRIVDTTSGGRVSEVENLVSPGLTPAWAPDGSAIAWDSALPDGGRGVSWWDFDADVIVVASEGMGSRLLGWAPDGATILVARDVSDGASSRTEIWRLDPRSGATTRLAEDAYGAALQPPVAVDPDPARPTLAPAPAWIPGVEGGVPAAVADRAPVPFCGVGSGSGEAGALRCFDLALAENRVVEMATDTTNEGTRLLTIVRSNGAGGGEITWLTAAPGRVPLWERQACERLVVRADGLEIQGCGPLEPIR